jgi:hypothetical protein
VSTGERLRYKKLPGCRRGIMRGASVWLGPDHLLLIRSWRFREEYKRYYMGDIQSIAVAAAPRFHLSTRSIGIGILWLVAISIATARGISWEVYSLWVVAAVLVGTWIYISASCSCICRIYTAVSGDDLPSVYRSWTARKFMQRVQPQIAAAQGPIGEDWAEAVEARRIGPPEEGPSSHLAGMPVASDVTPGRTQAAGRSAALAALFVAANIVDAVFSFAAPAKPSGLLTAVGYSIVVIELALAIALLIRHARGRPWPAMRNLAIALIVVTGVVWYSQQVLLGLITAMATTGGAQPARTFNGVFHNFDIGSHLVIGVVGLALVLSQRQRPRAIITE